MFHNRYSLQTINCETQFYDADQLDTAKLDAHNTKCMGVKLTDTFTGEVILASGKFRQKQAA